MDLATDRGLWRAAAAGIWIACTIGVVLGMLGAPTGLGTGVDLSAAIVLNTACLAIVCRLFAWLFGRFRLPLPPLTIGSLLYAAPVLATILCFADMDVLFSILITLFYLFVFASAVVLLAVLTGSRFEWRARTSAALAAALLIGSIAGWLADGLAEAAPAAAPLGTVDGAAVEALLADDPSVPGDYAYSAFTYGSGKDKHRSEFGEDVTLASPSVDASRLFTNWSWLREQFWGFDERNLPLNGRVWMPEGDGPFPIVLMVHGNHLMEDFSDEGYDYLGELLASRGIIAVSVDENFLNYSVWSGIPDRDFQARAWMLLQHIGQLQRYAADPSTPFYGRIDFGRVSLLGHSRGGQAAAMATDRNAWFPPDAPDLPKPGSYTIRSVAAIAPTDTSVDGRQAQLRDVSYLTMQGGSDADISNYDGERQYMRASFSADAEAAGAFKATLYIAGANHGQFNTEWGDRDEALPAGLFLNKPDIAGEDQRQVAKAYVSAFLEATLNGREQYQALFRDYRAGAAFLPDGRYYNRYENAAFDAVARFDPERPSDPSAAPPAEPPVDPSDRLSQPAPGVAGEGQGLTKWKLEEARDREGRGKGTFGAVLQWGASSGSYTLSAANGSLAPSPGSGGSGAYLAFSMADLSWRDDDGSWTPDDTPQVTVELTDADGNVARSALDDTMPVRPVAVADYTWLGVLEEFMDDGRYKEEIEPVFQTYQIPVERFTAANPAFHADQVRRIAFRFAGSPGEVMLDDIGWTR